MSIHITCRKHPRYKAKRSPVAACCRTCWAIWSARQLIERESTEWEFRYMNRPTTKGRKA